MFFIVGMAFIMLVIIVLMAYSFYHRPPSESKIRVLRPDSAVKSE